MSNYGNESFTSLEGAEQVRAKPANLLGSADVNGAFHTLIEIIANSLDEVRALRNILSEEALKQRLEQIRQIFFSYTSDRVITIQDFGRGIPLNFNTKPKEWKYNWHLAFSKLYAGGKYEDELDTANSNYVQSLGTNGLGCTLTQYTSEFMNVESRRDGKVYTVSFKKGFALANYYMKSGELVQVVLDVEDPESYYKGAVVPAYKADGTKITVELDTFDPYTDSRYKVDKEFAEQYGLDRFDNLMYKVKDEEGYVQFDENDEPIERPALFQQLYHSVLTVEKDTTEKQITSTKIEWRIDEEVFSDVNFTLQMLRDLLQTQANVNGVKITVQNEYHNIEEIYEGTTTQEYFHRLVGKDNIINEFSKSDASTGISQGKKYALEGEYTVAIINEDSLVATKHLMLHNTSLMTMGKHTEQTTKALVTFFRKIARQNKVEFKEQDYSYFFAFKIETYSNVNAVSFVNQTKKGVTNDYIGEAIYNNVTELLEDQYKRRNPALLSVIEKAIAVANFRIQSAQVKKTATAVNNIFKAELDLSKQFSDCSSSKAEECELLIVEGLSAKDTAVKARDRHTQAVFGIRGKLPNALKTPIEELLENELVRMLISVIGVGVDIADSNKTTYNYKKLKFHKIVIMADADEDGKQIRMLVFLLIYRLMKDLIHKGHVYLLETPILGYPLGQDSQTQKVAQQLLGEGKHTRAYSFKMSESGTLIKNFAQHGVILANPRRYKGLGSFDGQQLYEAAMRKENRRLIPLDFNTDNRLTREVIDILFGKDEVGNRKEIILQSLGMQLQQEELQDFVAQVEGLEENLEVVS